MLLGKPCGNVLKHVPTGLSSGKRASILDKGRYTLVRYESQKPMSKLRGLCLASTATLCSRKGKQLWLHRLTTSGPSDKRPVLPQHAEEGAL